MAEASAPKEAQPSAKESPKKLQKRVGKREVKGFYYHAAEYQRQKQNERKNVINKVLHGLAAPFSIHVQAWRLRHFAAKHGGRMQGWVLDNEFAKKALDNKLTDKDIREFKAKTQMHTVFEKYQVTKADEAMAKSVLQDIFNKKGKLSKEDMQRLQDESGMEEADIMRLATTAKENAGNGYLTVDEMKGKFADDALFGGLTEDQKKVARKICVSSWASTVLAAGKYGVLTAMAINPLFLGTAVGGAIAASAVNFGLSGGLRVASLLKEGNTYAMNKLRGVDHKQHINWANRIMGVDWDKDKKGFQIARAALVGTGIGLVLKFHPQLLDGLGDLVHHGIPDHIPHVGVVPLHADAAKTALESPTPMTQFHEHLSGYEQSVKTSFLPDTQHHDWQQLHTFVQEQKLPNGQTVNELKLSYNGVDDGIPHDQHYVDLMMPDGKQVFIQNDAVLAVNGPDADKLINVFGVVHEHGHTSFEQIGQVHSSNLAHQIGLDQPRIDNFAKLTHEAHGPHGNDGLWHGTQDASDLQTILHNRGLYNNGNNGNYLYGVRIGGGYVQHTASGYHFYIGASNHDFNHSLFTDKLAKNYNVPAPTVPTEEGFHSALATPLQRVDDFEDWQLHNTDNLAQWMQDHIFPEQLKDKPWLTAAMVSTPYIGSIAAGYLYGRNKEKVAKPLRWGARATEVGALIALPGLAVGAAAGRLAAYLQGRKKGEQTTPKASNSENPEVKPGGNPSGVSGASASPAAVAAMAQALIDEANKQKQTTHVASTAAVDEENNEVVPAPPAPATLASVPEDEAQVEAPTAESVESTVPLNEEAPVGAVPPLTETPETSAETTAEVTPQEPEESGRRVEGGVEGQEENGRRVEGEATPEAAENVQSTASTTVPVDTTDLDVPAVAATVAGSELLKDQQPFDALQSDTPQAEKEATFKNELQHTGAQELLEKLLTPIASRLGIPESEVQTRVTNLLQELGKFERVGAFIVVADKLYKLSKNPELLKDVLGKVTAAMSAHAGQAKGEVMAAVKEALASSGEAGAELAALGEEALPIIEEVAPILA